jgi:Smg protein
MKASLLEILISLLAHQVNKAVHGANLLSPEQAMILATSSNSDLAKATAWFETLVNKSLSPIPSASTFHIRSSIRIYPDEERNKLGEEGIKLLEELVQIKVLSLAQREVVIDQLMKLDTDEIPIHQLRWVLFVALATEAKNAEQLCWLDCLVLKDHRNRTVH